MKPGDLVVVVPNAQLYEPRARGSVPRPRGWSSKAHSIALFITTVDAYNVMLLLGDRLRCIDSLNVREVGWKASGP